MLRLFRRCKLFLAFNVLLEIAVAALTIAAAGILERILDAVIAGDGKRFIAMAWVSLGYFVIMIAVAAGASIVEKKVVVTVISNLRADAQQSVLIRDCEGFGRSRTADYLSGLTNDVKIVEENVVVPLLKAVQCALIFVMAAAALFMCSPLIGAVMMVGLVLMYLPPACLGRMIGKRQEAYSEQYARYTAILKDRLSGYDVLRSCRLIASAIDDLARQSDGLAARKFKVDRLLALCEGMANVIGAGLQIGTMVLVGMLVLRGEMLAGMLLAILQISGAFVQPVGIIMQSLPMIQGAKPILSRIEALSRPMPSRFSGTRSPRFEREIQFDSVEFSYVPNRPVLSGLSVKLAKGGAYVLTGESGCGKSTLMHLLAAEHGNYSGAIRIDNIELHELDIDRLLAMVSIIRQDVYIFDETLEYNIALGRSFSKGQRERALSISGVGRFLAQTEQGLATQAGELGANLSGGQKQRIGVARAIIAEKPLLILDEGTGAVDAQTAYEIESALLEIDELTLISVTHDLKPELLRRYDAVLFMRHGRIDEVGTYDALVARRGGFASFQNMRASAEEPTPDESRPVCNEA